MQRLAKTLFGLLALVLVTGNLPSCNFDHDSLFSSENLLRSDGYSLRQTLITPRLQEPIRPGKNVLWCGTFQLAWNEICSLIGEDLHFQVEPAMVPDLNRKTFTRGDLDEESYVALAGFVRDGVYEKIPHALEDKFHGLARPHALPPRGAAWRPQDIVAYSYLFKDIAFAQPFERFDDGMDFAGTKVECFGVGVYKRSQAPMLQQVSILDYAGPDDFIIELKSKSPGDRLILAKVSPAATLEKTIESIRSREAKPRSAHDTWFLQMRPGDILEVPKFNFDLTRTYGELIDLHLLAKNPNIAKDLTITSAQQDIRFQMDEKGVHLRSESHISIGCSAGDPSPQHVMIFNRPFLIMMMQSDRQTPYFALWVDNAELLMKKKD